MFISVNRNPVWGDRNAVVKTGSVMNKNVVLGDIISVARTRFKQTRQQDPVDHSMRSSIGLEAADLGFLPSPLPMGSRLGKMRDGGIAGFRGEAIAGLGEMLRTRFVHDWVRMELGCRTMRRLSKMKKKSSSCRFPISLPLRIWGQLFIVNLLDDLDRSNVVSPVMVLARQLGEDNGPLLGQ
ncbi:hypothetical protein ACLOJK_021065 [Asimina triloba]